jgi:hypothetical protein
MKNTRSTHSRTIHLVDIENLLGGPSPTITSVQRLKSQYTSIAPVLRDDLVTVASSHHAALAWWYEWGPARRLLRSGPDGADLALLDVLANERVAERFEHIVIGSGNGIFAEPVARLHALGRLVTVVVRRGDHLSRRLRLASTDVRFLDQPGLARVIEMPRRAA